LFLLAFFILLLLIFVFLFVFFLLLYFAHQAHVLLSFETRAGVDIDSKVPKHVGVVLGHRNHQAEVVLEITAHILLILVPVAFSHANVALIKLLERPAQQLLVSLLQPSVQVEQRHCYRPVNVALSVWQLDS
jgi:hypothetical protein